MNNFNYEYLEGSPCIDAGNPNLIDADNTISDIGANFYNQSTDCTILGDINNDTLVNILDIVEIVNIILYIDNEYLECSDLNSDGVINVIDIINLVDIILNS